MKSLFRVSLIGLLAFGAGILNSSARLIPGTETELPKLVTAHGTYKLGKKPYPAGTRAKWVAEGRVLAKAPEGYLPQGKMLKGAADNRSYLPPIGDQGSEGSCVHWAGTYHTKTANMKRNNPALNITATSNQCSPRFTYNLTNAGEDNGGYGHEPFEIFMRYGVASLQQKPYVAGNVTALPVVADFIEGLHRRTTNYVWVWDWAPGATEINQLKAWLDAGGVAACGVNADDSFGAWESGDAPWVGDTSTTIDNINHMVTVCGYGTGFYLVANSWGPSYGSNGVIVVDSDYFENYFSDVMYPLEGTYEPATDYAKFTVRHTQRSDIRELLITANGANVWSNSPLPKDMPAGDPSGAFATDARDNLEVAIDLTQVSWAEANVVTARVKDAVSGNSGTVTVFTVKYDGTEYASPVVPVAVPYNAYTSAWVRLYQSTDTNVSFAASGATVGEGSGSYVVTVQKTQASGDVSGQVTLSGTATEGAGADYTISGTDFAMNGATTSATFTVTLNDDADEESFETVVLTLANVAGGLVQEPSVFTLTIGPSDLTGGSVLISQYTETDSGTEPKGIEIWNASVSDLTFDGGANLLNVKIGVNGAAATSVLTVASGTLAAGDVWVIGTSDMSPDITQAFTYNGDDAIVLELGGVVQDVIGDPGTGDPGSGWAGNGVQTYNQNIQLKLGTTFGDPDGWTDPSERFEYVDVGSVLTGFGEPPGGWTDVPPVLGSIGNKSVIWSNDLNFAVSAADAADGDSIVLSASNLPAGATFATVTNAGTVTNAFSWLNAGPMGVYTTTFWAVDADGADSETITITVGDGSGPSEIVFQGFEGTAADTWGITAANNVQSLPGAGDTPANQRIRTGSYSWQPGDSTEITEILELDEVDVSAYSDVLVTLHLSATSTDTNNYGMFPTDTMSFSLALDGGGYPATADLTVKGNELEADGIVGVLWGYDAAGIAATTAGVPRAMAPASGGLAADGLATVQIALPTGTTAVKLKASVYQEYAGYYWNVDDISLAGVADGGAADLPPTIAVSPAGAVKSISVSNNLSFAITGREIPNDAADEVRIWATGLPAGATFPEVSGSSVLTNTFSWTPETTGTTVVSFFAGDKDGTNQLDVTLTVFQQLPVGTYRAVICGISDYEGTDNDLTYCDDDAQEMYDRLLTGSNWSADNIQLLLNSQATEGNVQAAIAAMGAASVPGDVNLFFFSGHGGGDMPDADGDEDGDGYDEYMCPYNLTTDEITDDELGDWLDALPTDNIIVLLDTCFSGGHLKAANGLTYKGYSRTGKTVSAVNGFADDLRKKTKKDSDELVSPYIATACDEEELSAEDSEIQNGVFAYYLLEALTNSDVNVDGWAAGEEAFEYLYPKAVAYNSEQHPQEYDGWPGLANILTWEPLVDQPPTISFTPTGTNHFVALDGSLAIVVTATEPDDDAVTLTVSNLPAGATFNATNKVGSLLWDVATPVGVYAVTFTAEDEDGSTEKTLQIRVSEYDPNCAVILSEYVEGSGNNKAVEIYNPGPDAIDLAAGDYVLRVSINGGSSSAIIALAGTVAAGGAHVVAYSGSSSALLALADQVTNSLTHNGDDAIVLYSGGVDGTVLDSLGQVGTDPGDFWGTAPVTTKDYTLRRKAAVTKGDTVTDDAFNPATEWDAVAIDTFDGLGSHANDCGEDTPPVLNPIGNRSVTVNETLQFSVVATVTDGDAVALTATNLPEGATFDSTNAVGSFVWENASPTNVYSVTFRATDKDGTDEETISITVGESAPPGGGTYTETFNNTAFWGGGVVGSYNAKSFTNNSADPAGDYFMTTSAVRETANSVSSNAWRLGNDSAQNVYLRYVVLTNITRVAMQLARWDNSPTPNFQIRYSLDAGANYTTLFATNGSWFAGDLAYKAYDSGTVAIQPVGAQPVWIEVFRSSGERFLVDDFEVDFGGSAEPPVDGPPVLGAIGNRSVTENETLLFQVSATPTDGDAVTLTVSNLPAGATFNPTNENGTFEWIDASPADVYDVTFYATDENGSDSETISITVGAASSELLAPVIQAASNIQANQFNANWLASDGATGYRLDVGTNDTFTGGGDGGGNLMENAGFETGTTNGWDKFEAEYAVVTTSPQEGTYAVQCTATATRDLMQTVDIAGDGTTEYEISYYYKASGDGTDVRIWSTWAAGGQVSGDVLTSSTFNATTADWTKMTYHVVPSSGANTLNFEVRVYSGGTASLDNFFVGASSGGRKAPSYVPGYANLDVGNATSVAVTGLTENVTYYYRAKAYNATSNSPYSGTTSVVTTASAGTPPALNAIGAQSVFLGETLQFHVSAAPTDEDVVTLSASNRPAGSEFYPTNELGTFLWTGAAPTGTFAVTFRATDKDGTDEETVSITVHPAPHVNQFGMSGNSPSAQFTSVSGRTYRLMYTTNLIGDPLVWEEADSTNGTGGSITLTDGDPADPMRYYRLTAP